jgi:peroxiredoxin
VYDMETMLNDRYELRTTSEHKKSTVSIIGIERESCETETRQFNEQMQELSNEDNEPRLSEIGQR